MTAQGRHADSFESAGRTLCEIAQLLESAREAEGRLRGALDLLGKLVPYDQCALLEAEVGCDPRLIAWPALESDENGRLTNALIVLFGQMLEERALSLEGPQALWGAHLAVPLIGLDEVIGVLFVRRNEGTYDKGNLRLLSLVAAQLAAYLTLLRARDEEVGRSQELTEARGAAEDAHGAKDELVHLVGGLKTPMAAAMAWVRLLGSPDLTADERARAVATIERNARTHSALLGDLLDLSSAAADDVDLDLRTVEAAAAIEAVIEGLRPLAERRSIRLEAELDRSVGPVTADADRLDEILSILLTNAFEFTPDGGRITVRLEPAGARARIQVIDSGKRLGAGGFGLAFAEHVVVLHGGTMSVVSRGEDPGTTSTVEIPFRR